MLMQIIQRAGTFTGYINMSKLEKILVKTLIVLFILIVGNTLNGCKSKIKLVETHTSDTIYKTEIVRITEPVFNEVFIESPCDSLGNLKPINIVTNTPKAKVTLKSVKNDLILEVNIDSIVDRRINEFKSSYRAEKIETTVIKFKNKKLLWQSLILNILFLGWIFRKPLFKFLKL